MLSPISSAATAAVAPPLPTPVPTPQPQATAATAADTVHISPQATAMHDGDHDCH